MKTIILKSVIVAILVVVIGTLLVITANSDEKTPLIEAYDRQTNTIYAYQFHVSPWGFKDKDGKATGIVYDTMLQICEGAGFNCVIELVPYPRMLKMISTGTSYFATIFPGKEMEVYSYKVEQGASLEVSIIGLKDSIYNSLEELQGKTVGIIKGSNYDAELMENQAIKKYYLTDVEQGIKMVKANRIDAIAGATLAIFYEANKLGYLKNEFSEPLVLSDRNWWLMVSQKAHNEKVTEALKVATASFRRNNKMKLLIKKYIH